MINNLAIIPARSGSKGIPGKNLKKIAGKPLIYWTINSAIESKYISRVIVSTDSPEILEISQSYGAECPFMRPSNISDDFASTESVIEHCCNWLSENEGYTPDNIFLLQPTSPIRKEGSIDMSFELFLEEKADSLLSVNRFHHFLWEDKKNPNALYNYKKRPRRQDIDEVDIKFIENGSIYITKYNAFMRDLNRLSGSISLFEMHDEEAYEIDTPLDFIIVESILKNTIT